MIHGNTYKHACTMCISDGNAYFQVVNILVEEIHACQTHWASNLTAETQNRAIPVFRKKIHIKLKCTKKINIFGTKYQSNFGR